MKFGHFDPAAQEFIIQNPRTPAPWINYLGTLSFGGYIDQTGGLLLCRGDPSQNRITYYPPCADKRAFKGESAYAVVHRLGAPTSYVYPYCVPAMKTLESYECRVGPGYSIFTTRTSGLQFRITVLVPPKSSILLRSYEVTNEERCPLMVTIVPVVRYSHFDAIKQLTNADWVPQTMQSDLRKDESGRTILLQYPFMRKAGPVNFFSASLPVSSFETRLEASIGDAEEMTDRARYYGDDHLWAVIAVSAYIMETGDADFLNREAPYHQSAKSFSGSGTVLEHLLRALDFTDASIGTHGLPLLGFADWNDTINLSTGAESCLCACLYGYATSRLADVLAETDPRIVPERDSIVRNLRRRYAEMRERYLACAWDGSWFTAYFDASGKALGSSATDARIFSYAQSWPVIAGFAPQKLGIAAMDALERLLFTNRGIKLMTPPYTAYDPNVGGVSTYPPGAKENGGIFMHTNPWAVLAECELGRIDLAYTYFSRMNPLSRLDEAELYGAEPYVYAQNVLGDEHKDFGLARNSWLTGTASWAQIAAQEGILGIRPRADGLHLVPNLPADWDGYKAIRRYRGSTVSVSVKRARVTQPVLVLDGRITDASHGETASGKHVSFLVPCGYLSGKKFVNAELQVPETH